MSGDVHEAPVWIAINGVRRILLTCAPIELPALAVGHLLGEAWIDVAAAARVHGAVSGPGGAYGVDVGMDEARMAAAEALRRHRSEHGCGIRHILDCSSPIPPRGRGCAVPELASVFRTLFAAADAAAPGGVHAAALCGADGVLRHTSIDVARHCAVDRALGLAALAGTTPSDFGLVISSRISGAIALKAVHTGMAWVASRSIATPLARELAEAAGMRLIEQAARRSP